MPIRVKCQSCKKTLSVKDHLAGKKIKCPVCEQVVPIPAASDAAASPTPAPETKLPAPKASPAAKAKPSASVGSTAKRPASAGTTAKDRPNADTATAPNGKSHPDTNAGNPDATKSSSPQTPEIPPENVEDEALAALADEPEPVEDAAPKTIEFVCQWCDETVQVPIEQGGKQIQCPNAECRRIVKVPMPKVEGKKDWRKMDRRGPAAALINQPEELEDAWGTETATRARQDSLAKAGAVEAPRKPPVGAFGWIYRGFVTLCVIGLAGAGVFGILRLRSSNKQHQAIDEIEKLVRADDPKIKDPLLRAEAHRTLALLYLREPTGAIKAMRNFEAAVGLVEVKPMEGGAADKKAPVNEELFLIDLAVSQVELGGSEDEAIAKKKKQWKDIQPLFTPTLAKIQAPEAQVMALRELGSRLIEKNQPSIAFQLAGSLSSADPATKAFPAAYRQYIALLYAKGDADTKKRDLPAEPDLSKSDFAKDLDPNHRVGFAEAYARLDKYEEAFKLATAKGGANDRLDACLGVGFIALQERKAAEGTRFFKEALNILKERDAFPSPWHYLQLVKLGSRLEDHESIKPFLEKDKMPDAFRLRAQLEILLAKCEVSPGSTTGDDFAGLEAADKEGVSLALAWNAYARLNGATRDQNRKTLENRISTVELPAGLADFLRPMVDIGSYLGTKK